jgi:hypothetical protein
MLCRRGSFPGDFSRLFRQMGLLFRSFTSPASPVGISLLLRYLEAYAGDIDRS